MHQKQFLTTNYNILEHVLTVNYISSLLVLRSASSGFLNFGTNCGFLFFKHIFITYDLYSLTLTGLKYTDFGLTFSDLGMDSATLFTVNYVTYEEPNLFLLS
jgi:hypothetical protein